MRRLAIAALVGAVAGAVPAAVEASHTDGAGPNEDFVTGSVRGPFATPFGTFAAEYHVNARAAGPEVPGLGAPAKGWFRTRLHLPEPFTVPETEVRGRVTCINNVGNSSITHGLITESNSPVLPVGSGTTTRHVDNGEGADAPPDMIFGTPSPPPSGAADCPQVPFPTAPVEQGNLVVHDAGS